ncbi:unnamed protein product [Amoebophrya sp. A120]|nr:unnamed protein product [Amoebophrya sp. A120]|eukprot:GSA120T00016508001.1
MYLRRLPNGVQLYDLQRGGADVDASGQPWYPRRGLGHVDGEGGKLDAARRGSGFGEDFKAQSNKYTKEFCELDSDGDGMTNGLELGDPCCEWDLATYGDATDLWPGGRTDLSTLTQPGLADEKSVVDAQNALYGKAVVCTTETDQGLGAAAAEGTESTQEQGGGADSGDWADTGTSGGNEEQGSSDTKGGAGGAGDTKSNSSSKNEGGGGFLCC